MVVQAIVGVVTVRMSGVVTEVLAQEAERIVFEMLKAHPQLRDLRSLGADRLATDRVAASRADASGIPSVIDGIGSVRNADTGNFPFRPGGKSHLHVGFLAAGLASVSLG